MTKIEKVNKYFSICLAYRMPSNSSSNMKLWKDYKQKNYMTGFGFGFQKDLFNKSTHNGELKSSLGREI